MEQEKFVMVTLICIPMGRRRAKRSWTFLFIEEWVPYICCLYRRVSTLYMLSLVIQVKLHTNQLGGSHTIILVVNLLHARCIISVALINTYNEQTLVFTFPPVYTCLVGLLMVTAHTTSPWFKVLICLACRGMPGPMSASGGNGTGCIWPSAFTW